MLLKMRLLLLEGEERRTARSNWMARKVATRLLVFAYPIDINHIGICDINSLFGRREKWRRYNLYLKYRERNREKEKKRENREGGGGGEGSGGRVTHSGCIVCVTSDVFLPFIFFLTIRIVCRMNDRIVWVGFPTARKILFSFIYGEIHTSIYIGWPESRFPSVAFSLTTVEFGRL